MDELSEALDEMDSALQIGSQWPALVAMAKALRLIAEQLKGSEP